MKLDQIIICTLFECKWNRVSSSVLRIMFVIANCVLREYWKQDKEKQNVTSRYEYCELIADCVRVMR
jgi:hypothetical protein